MRIRLSIHKLFAAGVLLLLFSCVENTAYHASYTIPDHIWEKKDTITFAVDSLSIMNTIQLEIEIRTLKTYPYQDLSMIIEQDWQKQKPQRDTITLQLEKTDFANTPIFLTTSASIPYPIHTSTKGKIKIYHFMKRESLVGINDVSIHLTY